MAAPRPVELRSDNAAGAAPAVLAALSAADSGSDLAYGGDVHTARLRDVVREVFDHPTATVHPVASGTAANSLSLATLCPPWGSIFCHETAHILVNECNATSMFSGGGAIRGVGGAHARIDDDALRAALDGVNWGDPHHSQPAVLSLTCPSDLGTIYTPDEMGRLGAIARGRGLRMHVDGARFANAVVANHCAPADLAWRAGVDLLSLGSIKNGGLSCDAIVCFDPALDDELTYRLKRAGHVASKMRYQSAQLVAHLSDGLWLDLASRANEALRVLVDGIRSVGLDLVEEPAVNMLFVRVDDGLADHLEAEGLLFYRLHGGVIRFVTSHRSTPSEMADAVTRIERAVAANRTAV